MNDLNTDSILIKIGTITELTRQLQEAREQLEKANKLANIARLIMNEDEADIVMEFAEKYLKDKQEALAKLNEKQGGGNERKWI